MYKKFRTRQLRRAYSTQGWALLIYYGILNAVLLTFMYCDNFIQVAVSMLTGAPMDQVAMTETMMANSGWGYMLAILVGALVYYNVIHKDPEVAAPPPVSDTNSDIPVGGEVGKLCYSVDLDLIGQDGTVSVKDTRGKVTVINFWGTWCGPCVAELINEFPHVTEEYGDKVAVLAVHSNMGKEGATTAYLQENFPNSDYIFCVDQNNEYYCKLLGGGMAWPHTVILDEEGVIVKIIARATTYEELKEVIDGILAD